MLKNTNRRPSFAALARRYLSTLDAYREAKSAVGVVGSIGQDTADIEYHAAKAQALHQEAFSELVEVAVQLRETGAA